MRRVLALPLAAALLLAAPRQLAILNEALHQFEDGPALRPGYGFRPGETVFLSFQVTGYRVSESERILLEYRIETRDPDGIPLEPPRAGKVDASLAVEDKDWMPKARYDVLVPPLAPPGEYRMLITLTDKLAAAEIRKEIPFQVRGREVAPSPTLVVRNFRFLRGEEDGDPLPVAAYRPGDAVWARFDITGYKLAEKNRLHVEYGVSVLRPDGEVLYSEPQAAAEKDESFYPKRYVPGILSLQLDPDIAPGEYTIVLAVRDELGGQKHETRATFRIE